MPIRQVGTGPFPEWPLASRQTSWSTSQVDAAQSELDRIVEAAPSATLALAAVLEAAIGPQRSEGPGVQLPNLLAALKALELGADGARLDRPTIETLVKTARTLMHLNGIQPETSKLSHLHGRLLVAKGRLAGNQGRLAEQLWECANALRAAAKSDSSADEVSFLFWVGSAALRQGFTSLATQILQVVVSDPAAKQNLRHAAALRLATALRLSGDPGASNGVLSSLQDEEGLAASGVLAQLRWSRTVNDAIASGSSGSWEMALADPAPTDAALLFEHAILCLASSSRAVQARACRASGLKTAECHQVPPDELRLYGQILNRLRDAARKGVEPQEKLDHLRTVLDLRQHLPSLEQEILCTAACYQTLVRMSQDLHSAIVFAEYRNLCLAATDGRSPDTYKLMGSAESPNWYRVRARSEVGNLERAVLQSDIPISRWNRSKAFYRTAMSVMGTVANTRSRMIFAGKVEAERLKIVEAEHVAEALTKNMGSLKGAFMKIGQLLSSLDLPLPASVRGMLADLGCQSVPVANEKLFDVFRSELSLGIEEAFSKVALVPVGVGSIGQVYKVELLDGRLAAVKIQYPGIRDSIVSDMASARVLTPLLGVFARHLDVKGILDEVERRFLGETDYRSEREAQVAARAYVNDHLPDVIVPEVFSEFCSARVLTTEFLTGMDLATFAEVSDEPARNRASVASLEFLLAAIFSGRPLHADPNPANFQFRPDGRIIVYDFGCHISSQTPAVTCWIEGLRAALNDDFSGYRRAMEAAGFVAVRSTFDFDYEFALARFVLGPALADARFRFSPDFLRECVERMSSRNPNVKVGKLPPEIVFMYRVLAGGFTLLTRLRANFNFRRVLLPHVFGDESRWPAAVSVKDEKLQRHLAA